MEYLPIILIIVVLIIMLSGIKIVPQAMIYVVERFGAFRNDMVAQLS